MADEQPTAEKEEAAPEAAEESAEITIPEDFDPERAMRTIKAQRESEEALKAELAKYREEEEKRKRAEEEAQKTLEQKIAEREARIAELEAQAEERLVKADFISKAAARGYTDPELAYIAAAAQGVVGAADPKTGVVGDHDFDALEARHPSLAAEAEDEADKRAGGFSGDAGVRGRKAAKTPGDLFNEGVRGAIRGF